MLLSNPIETPKMADFGFFMRPGLEARIAVKPRKIDSTETLKNIDIEKRQCFFPEERYLQFYRFVRIRRAKLRTRRDFFSFRSYTEKNCKLECQANRTLKSCNCVPYFLPSKLKMRVYALL